MVSASTPVLPKTSCTFSLEELATKRIAMTTIKTVLATAMVDARRNYHPFLVYSPGVYVVFLEPDTIVEEVSPWVYLRLHYRCQVYIFPRLEVVIAIRVNLAVFLLLPPRPRLCNC